MRQRSKPFEGKREGNEETSLGTPEGGKSLGSLSAKYKFNQGG